MTNRKRNQVGKRTIHTMRVSKGVICRWYFIMEWVILQLRVRRGPTTYVLWIVDWLFGVTLMNYFSPCKKRIKEFMMDYQPLFQVVHILQSITLVLTFLALGDFSNCKLIDFTFSPMKVCMLFHPIDEREICGKTVRKPAENFITVISTLISSASMANADWFELLIIPELANDKWL